jgi:hypothetical protein
MLIYWVEVYIIQRKTQTLVDDSNEKGLEVHADNTTFTAMSQDQNAGQNHNTKTDNKIL